MLEEIISQLYVGGDQEYNRVAAKDGWSWLRCCKDGPGSHRQTLGYHTMAAPKGENYLWVRRGKLMALNMLDMDDPAFFRDELIDPGLNFIRERISAGDKVLVACNQGVSRGPSTALMYLRAAGEMPYSFPRSERMFRTLYRKYDPGLGIRKYAKAHWSQLEEKFNASK